MRPWGIYMSVLRDSRMACVKSSLHQSPCYIVLFLSRNLDKIIMKFCMLKLHSASSHCYFIILKVKKILTRYGD